MTDEQIARLFELHPLDPHKDGRRRKELQRCVESFMASKMSPWDHRVAQELHQYQPFVILSAYTTAFRLLYEDQFGRVEEWRDEDRDLFRIVYDFDLYP